jgi:hypothetical protein
MSDRRNALAVAIMAGKLIGDELKGRSEREELAKIMAAEDSKQTVVRDAEDTELGKATLCGGGEKAKVVNEAALLVWVKANRPDQLRQIVEPAFVKALLKTADKEGVAVDEETGEVIPGIEFMETGAYVTVTPNATAKERMAELIHDSGLLQLTKARRVVAELPPTSVVPFEGLEDEEESPW